MSEHDEAIERGLTRRSILQRGAGLGAAVGAWPLLAACGGSSSSSSASSAASGASSAASSASSGVASAASSVSAKGSGKVVIGAFEDGALTPFKQKMIPLFKEQTGIDIEFLTEPYDSFFAKAFQDGTSKAGQYDIYIMDDPWIPQYAAAGILEDLGKHGVKGDAGFSTPFLDLGYWPPRSGPRVKGF